MVDFDSSVVDFSNGLINKKPVLIYRGFAPYRQKDIIWTNAGLSLINAVVLFLISPNNACQW